MTKKRSNSKPPTKTPAASKNAKNITKEFKTEIADLQEKLKKEKKESRKYSTAVKALYEQIEDKNSRLEDEIRKFEKTESKLKASHKKLRETKKELVKMTKMDPLTSLLNRRGLQEALTREVQRMKRFATDLVAIIIDLDDFKSINDTLGLAVGDIVLKEVSRRMAESLRQTDFVSRIGGDEFMILLPGTREAEGRFVAEKIRLSIINTPIYISTKKNTKVQASFGVMAVSRRTTSVDELLAEINPILKLSKSSGKDMVSIIQDGQMIKSDRKRLVADAIESLRVGDRIRAVKQPIVELISGKIIGYEFLSRLTLKEFEMPNDFFQICLEENILTLVDHQCLKACIKAGQDLPPEMDRHVNLFPSTILDIPSKDLIEEFSKGNKNNQYCIEISEQQIIGSPAYLVEPLKAIRRKGISIAIDDVGFGNSCLESLIILEPEIFKIDRKCVDGLDKDPALKRLLERLLQVAKALDAKVVAEGIERVEDAQVLIDYGVKLGQGYYYGKPS